MTISNLTMLVSRDLATSNQVNKHVFGVNMLFDRDHDPDDPTGMTVAPNYVSAISELGARTFRYPGGAVSERLFELTNPNGANQDYMGNSTVPSTTLALRGALDYAGQQGLDMTFVMPTYRFLGATVDAAGHRYAAVDLPLISSFVQQLVADALERNVVIDAIELGNEWHVDNSATFGTRMTPIEYGRIASSLAAETQQAINDFAASRDLPTWWREPEIVVQVGPGGKAERFLPDGHYVPAGYIGPTVLATSLIFREFNTDAEQVAVDGLLQHRYLTGSTAWIDGWAYKPFETFERLAANDSSFNVLNRYVTEWNVAARNTPELGLPQAGGIVSLMAELVAAGVDHANLWPVQQNNGNRLVNNTGFPSEVYGGLTIAGETFRLMQGAIVGLTYAPVAIVDNPPVVGHVFDSASTVVLYLISRSSIPQTWIIDPQSLAAGYKHVWGVAIGVGAGSVTDPRATPEISFSSADMLAATGGLSIELDPFEVIQLTFTLGSTGVFIDGHKRDDRLVGTPYGDTLHGEGGSDSVVGNSGDDRLFGGEGNDTVLGNNGQDTIRGSAGDDYADGGKGNDAIFGELGQDILRGRAGNDDLEGGAETDVLYGGLGNDTLAGQTGDDRLIGGDGADVFVFGRGDGRDTITDFSNDMDSIQMSDFGFASLDAVFTLAVQVGRNVEFHFAGGDTLIVERTTIGVLLDDVLI